MKEVPQTEFHDFFHDFLGMQNLVCMQLSKSNVQNCHEDNQS